MSDPGGGQSRAAKRRRSTPEPGRADLMRLEEVAAALDATLDGSTADETEIVWVEIGRNLVTNRQGPVERGPARERTLVARVIDRGRLAEYRTEHGSSADLHRAVRQAVAQTRIREPLPGLRHLPADSTPVRIGPQLFDRQLADLEYSQARGLLDAVTREEEQATFEWAEARVCVFNSRGLRRQVAVTAAVFSIASGEGPGAGTARGASRTLAGLDPEAIAARARRRRSAQAPGELPAQPLPVVLSSEAAAALIELLNRVAFSALAYHDGSSFLREHLGVQVFDRALSLRDDGTSPDGLPFPFDLEGTAKQPVDLLVEGTPKTPALDQRQAARLGLPPTGHSIGGNDARAENLFLVPGERSNREIVAAADGGLWISDLDSLECYEPRRLQIRARARGVRRLRDGDRAEPLPDLIWDESLFRVLASLSGIGREPVRLATAGVLGGVTCPCLGLAEVSGLRVR